MSLPAEDMNKLEHVPSPVCKLSIVCCEAWWVRFPDIPHVSAVHSKLSSLFVDSKADEDNDDQGRDGSRKVETNASSKYKRTHSGREVLRISASDEFKGSIGEGISGNNKEKTDSGRTLIPQSKDW